MTKETPFMEDSRSGDAALRSADVAGLIVTKLAELPANAHLDADALGSILGRCKKTVQRAVRRGELPPPIKFMGRQVWLVKTILAHMEARQKAALMVAERRALNISEKNP